MIENPDEKLNADEELNPGHQETEKLVEVEENLEEEFPDTSIKVELNRKQDLEEKKQISQIFLKDVEKSLKSNCF